MPEPGGDESEDAQIGQFRDLNVWICGVAGSEHDPVREDVEPFLGELVLDGSHNNVTVGEGRG